MRILVSESFQIFNLKRYRWCVWLFHISVSFLWLLGEWL